MIRPKPDKPRKPPKPRKAAVRKTPVVADESGPLTDPTGDEMVADVDKDGDVEED